MRHLIKGEKVIRGEKGKIFQIFSVVDFLRGVNKEQKQKKNGWKSSYKIALVNVMRHGK